MSTVANLDWLYLLLGWTLAAAGAALLVWAMFWDRSRGRRRCPKCWYSMEGVPGLRCPECGKEHRAERGLFKTRRRWRLAAVALVLFAIAHLIASVPDVRARGWWAAAPRPVLLAAMSLLDQTGPMNILGRSQNPLYGELVRRFEAASFGAPELYPWERWLVRPISRAMLTGSGTDQSKNVAAMFYVAAGEVDIESIPESTRARVIIARATKAYSGCATCRCTGVSGGKPFFIAFERSTGHFRFEYTDHTNGSLDARYVIWRNQTGLHRWWAIRPDDKSVPTKIDLELAGAYGVSSRASGTIPGLLLRSPNAVGVTDMLKASIGGLETIDGRECWRIDGTWWNGEPRSVWVDRQSFVICAASDQVGVEHYQSTEFNAAVDPAWFTFDPQHPEQSPLR